MVYFRVVIILTFSIIITIAKGQSEFSKPKLLKLFNSYRDTLDHPRSETYDLFIIYSKLYPIGWSKGGYFAYAYEPIKLSESADDITDIVVINLITDSIVSFFRRHDHFETVWFKENRTIWNMLNKYNIIQDTNFILKTFPITTRGIYLNTLFDSDQVSEDKTLTYQLQSSHNGRKTIYRHFINDIHEFGWTESSGFSIKGYVESPYEQRIAIFHTFTEMFGCGDAQYGVQTEVIGAHLNDGFKKL